MEGSHQRDDFCTNSTHLRLEQFSESKAPRKQIVCYMKEEDRLRQIQRRKKSKKRSSQACSMQDQTSKLPFQFQSLGNSSPELTLKMNFYERRGVPEALSELTVVDGKGYPKAFMSSIKYSSALRPEIAEGSHPICLLPAKFRTFQDSPDS
nr:hypothetical protein Iba_chr14dCG13190 [Ipomoea batatas]